MMPPVRLRQPCSCPRREIGIILASRNWNATPCGPENRPSRNRNSSTLTSSGVPPRNQPASAMPRICTRIIVPRNIETGRIRCAMLDLRRAGDRRDHAAELLQAGAEADEEIRTRDQMQIGRDEGRRIDEAKARHAQHAVHEMAGIVAAQIPPHEALIDGFAFGFAVDACVDVGHSAGACWMVKPVARR